MVIGQDVPVTRDDDPRTKALLAERARRALTVVEAIPKEPAQKSSSWNCVGDIWALRSVRIVTTAGVTSLTTSA